MKNNYFLKTSLVIGFLLLGSLSVSAWNVPQNPNLTTRTFGNIPAEMINVGCKFSTDGSCLNKQGKFGSFITESFLKAGNDFTWSNAGAIVAEKLTFVRSDAFFSKMFVPGTQGQVTFGLYRGLNDNTEIPLIGKFNNGENKVQLLADGQFCNTQTMITTDTPAIQFYNTANGTNANVRAHGIQLSGGNPQPGMVLVSTDLQGNAVWATPKLESDGITVSFVYGTPTSPVVDGQSSCD